MNGTYRHDTLSSTLFFPHWLTMGRKYNQKQIEIINELCPRFFLNLLREFFLSTHNMLDILSNGFNRKGTQNHKGQYKHENSISKHFLLKKFTGRLGYL